jgi:hypothetical protein
MSQRPEASCHEPAQCTARSESRPVDGACVSGQKRGVLNCDMLKGVMIKSSEGVQLRQDEKDESEVGSILQ